MKRCVFNSQNPLWVESLKTFSIFRDWQSLSSLVGMMIFQLSLMYRPSLLTWALWAAGHFSRLISLQLGINERKALHFIGRTQSAGFWQKSLMVKNIDLKDSSLKGKNINFFRALLLSTMVMSDFSLGINHKIQGQVNKYTHTHSQFLRSGDNQYVNHLKAI